MAKETLNTELYNALSTGDTKKVKEMLDLGAEVNGSCEAYTGITPLMKAAEWGRADAVELLLKKGAKINAKDPRGNTALHLVIANGYALTSAVDTVKALMKGKPDLKAKNKEGKTPLDLADDCGVVGIIKALQGK